MRLLVSFAGGSGHFLPLVPLADAARRRGDRVLVTGQSAMLPTVVRAGFTAVDSGGRTLADPAMRRPLAPVNRVRESAVLAEVFAGGLARRRAARLIDVARHWRPDVILHDEADFGAAVAAEALGLPHVGVIVLVAGGTVDHAATAAELDRTRARFGLPPDPGSAMLHRDLTLEPAPPGFRDPADPLPSRARRIRPAVLEPTPIPTEPALRRTLAWLDRHPGRPVVWFTLGTIFHQESGDLFHRVMSGLGGLDASVVITVGREIDPAELGRPPTNVLVERFVPQQVLLPRCDLLVCHAGSGSVLGALAFGVPMLLLPMGADQPANADRCAALTVAMVLDPLAATPAEVAATARTLLVEPRFRAAAAPWRQACATLPTAEQAVDWIREKAGGAGTDAAVSAPRPGSPDPAATARTPPQGCASGRVP